MQGCAGVAWGDFSMGSAFLCISVSGLLACTSVHTVVMRKDAAISILILSRFSLMTKDERTKEDINVISRCGQRVPYIVV